MISALSNASWEEQGSWIRNRAKGAGLCLFLCYSLHDGGGVTRQSQRFARFTLLSFVLNKRDAFVVSAEDTNEGVYNQK